MNMPSTTLLSAFALALVAPFPSQDGPGDGESTQDHDAGQAAEAGEEPGYEEYGMPFELVEGEPMFTVLPLDAIPAIDAPEFVSAAEAEAFLQPEETVLGVVGPEGTAKAYSAWQLDSHEIVNDVVDGAAIAATW